MGWVSFWEPTLVEPRVWRLAGPATPHLGVSGLHPWRAGAAILPSPLSSPCLCLTLGEASAPAQGFTTFGLQCSYGEDGRATHGKTFRSTTEVEQLAILDDDGRQHLQQHFIRAPRLPTTTTDDDGGDECHDGGDECSDDARFSRHDELVCNDDD